MLKTKLELQKLIQENNENYLTYKTSELEYQIKDSIFQEASMLLEYDEGDGHFKRNWGKYAAGGAGLALANGGAFGTGPQNFVHTGIQAINNMGHQALDATTNGLKTTSDYYGKDLNNNTPAHLNQEHLNQEHLNQVLDPYKASSFGLGSGSGLGSGLGLSSLANHSS
jgi:hypothetical protein